MQPIVIKIGGHELNDDAFLVELATVIKGLNRPTIIVHGGGKDITQLQERLGVETHFINGVRVTDADSLAIAEMVLSGLVNKRIVRILFANGVDGLGLSGVDRGIVRAQKMTSDIDMQFTGEIVVVDPKPLLQLLTQEVTPVLSPISLGEATNYNVNADHVAGAIAHAVHADRVIFITNIEGVLDGERRLLPTLTPAQTHQLIADGVINGGMIPKVTTAIEALQAGVARAVITNLAGLKTHGGTVFMLEESN